MGLPRPLADYSKDPRTNKKKRMLSYIAKQIPKVYYIMNNQTGQIKITHDVIMDTLKENTNDLSIFRLEDTLCLRNQSRPDQREFHGQIIQINPQDNTITIKGVKNVN